MSFSCDWQSCVSIAMDLCANCIHVQCPCILAASGLHGHSISVKPATLLWLVAPAAPRRQACCGNVLWSPQTRVDQARMSGQWHGTTILAAAMYASELGTGTLPRCVHSMQLKCSFVDSTLSVCLTKPSGLCSCDYLLIAMPALVCSVCATLKMNDVWSRLLQWSMLTTTIRPCYEGKT